MGRNRHLLSHYQWYAVVSRALLATAPPPPPPPPPPPQEWEGTWLQCRQAVSLRHSTNWELLENCPRTLPKATTDHTGRFALKVSSSANRNQCHTESVHVHVLYVISFSFLSFPLSRPALQDGVDPGRDVSPWIGRLPHPHLPPWSRPHLSVSALLLWLPHLLNTAGTLSAHGL